MNSDMTDELAARRNGISVRNLRPISQPPAAVALPGRPLRSVQAKPQVTLTAAGSLDLDQAELFLFGLADEMAAETPRTAYLLGLAEGHLANLIELLRAVTR